MAFPGFAMAAALLMLALVTFRHGLPAAGETARESSRADPDAAAETESPPDLFAVSSQPPAAPQAAPRQRYNRADVTVYTSYPEPDSDECVKYSGCEYEGQFAALPDKMDRAWVSSTNIVAVHEAHFQDLKLKQLLIRGDDGREIVVRVYDMCADADCGGCCTLNAASTGFLLDLESHTAQRFGQTEGVVEWTCLDC